DRKVVSIVIASGRETVGPTGSQRQYHPEIKPFTRLDRAKQIDSMSFIEVSTSPLAAQIIVVCRPRIDSAGIVVGPPQRILDCPVKESTDSTAQHQFQSV